MRVVPRRTVVGDINPCVTWVSIVCGSPFLANLLYFASSADVEANWTRAKRLDRNSVNPSMLWRITWGYHMNLLEH